jgi:hypothetical protein
MNISHIRKRKTSRIANHKRNTQKQHTKQNHSTPAPKTKIDNVYTYRKGS